MIEQTLELPGGGRVWFATRARGNLSTVAGEGAERAGAARERLREHLGLVRLAATRQVHGASVLRVEQAAQAEHGAADRGLADRELSAASGRAPEPAEADGQVTGAGGVGLLVLSADCLPVALASDRGVAALHAGWRGLAGGVLERGLGALRALGGGGDVLAVIGPGAGPCCYEVGPEVHAALTPSAGVGTALHGAGAIDLKALAARRLRAAGVPDVVDLDLCTICDRRFFSHRREGVSAGRQGMVVWRERR